jgi:polar amino acid transport system substrate-binding protein
LGVIPISYDDDVHPYDDLVAGRVDAVLLDNIIAERSLRRSGGKGFVIQPEPVATGHYVAVLARSDSVLRDSVDALLRDRMRDGSLEKTFRAWNVWNDAQARYIDAASARAHPTPAVRRRIRGQPPLICRRCFARRS